jgi:hypothetical protein
MLSIYNARAKQRSIHSHRERGVYEGIVERMGKEKERQLELTKINTYKKK